MTLLEFIKSKKIKKVRVAEALGITPVHLHYVATGHSRPSPGLAARIEQYTEGAVSAADLLAHLIPPGYEMRRIELGGK